MIDIKKIIQYLEGHFRRGRPILMTGAGFSREAKNLKNQKLPFGSELAEQIWNLVYPGDIYEPQTSLQDIFEIAKARHKNDLERLLKEQLTVDPHTSDLTMYENYFSLPWFRCYTLNADNLDKAVDAKYKLKRRIEAIDGMPEKSETTDKKGHIGNKLFSVHLHGIVENGCENLTFGMTQYALRGRYTDSWYSTFASEIMTHPVVFVGTNLDEPSLWSHIEQRSTKGGRGVKEHRRKSFLVTPNLSKARAGLLEAYNVEWIQMDGLQFYDQILKHLVGTTEIGLKTLSETSRNSQESIENDKKLYTVEEFLDKASKEKIDKTACEFLEGSEPTWNDLRCGAAAERESNKQLFKIGDDLLSQRKSNVLILTGTAGSGKSTLAKSLALHFHESGAHIGWIDEIHRPHPRTIRKALDVEDGPKILFIEDAEIYGNSLESVVRELLSINKNRLIVITLRSNLVRRYLGDLKGDSNFTEFDVPHLKDQDIDGILDSLDKFNRLGLLKGKPREEQKKILSGKCGRQLLVAMIEATSGRDFDEKCVDEFEQLTKEEKKYYSTAVIATLKGISIGKDDLIISTEQQSNSHIELLENLINRGLLLALNSSLKVRHKVISEKVFDHMVAEGYVPEALAGLLFSLCAKLDTALPKNTRPWRNVSTLLNNEFLFRSCGKDLGDSVYGEVEIILKENHHYWLQRGTFHVKYGNLNHAEQFINQAYALEPKDDFVLVERCYLRLKIAHSNPLKTDAKEIADESISELVGLIERRGYKDPYPVHILGIQALSWLKNGPLSKSEKLALLTLIRQKVEESMIHHSRRPEIQELQKIVNTEYLSMAVEK